MNILKTGLDVPKSEQATDSEKKRYKTAEELMRQIIASPRKFHYLSINQISEEFNSSWEVAKRAVELLTMISQSCCRENVWFDIISVGRKTQALEIVEANVIERAEEDKLQLLRREPPEPENLILGQLYLARAFPRTDGVKLEVSLAVRNLLEYGHIKAKEGGYVLTELGKTIGQGMLSMFPDYFKLEVS